MLDDVDYGRFGPAAKVIEWASLFVRDRSTAAQSAVRSRGETLTILVDRQQIRVWLVDIGESRESLAAMCAGVVALVVKPARIATGALSAA